MTLLQPMMVAALLASGLGAACCGTSRCRWPIGSGSTKRRVGGLVSIFAFIMIPAVFSAGFLTDHVGKQAVLVGGGALVFVRLVLLSLAQSYAAALAAVLLLGGGWSLLINVGNVLTPHAFPGGVARATNLANVYFGIGAFLTLAGHDRAGAASFLPLALLLLSAVTLTPAAASPSAWTFPSSGRPSLPKLAQPGQGRCRSHSLGVGSRFFCRHWKRPSPWTTSLSPGAAFVRGWPPLCCRPFGWRSCRAWRPRSLCRPVGKRP